MRKTLALLLINLMLPVLLAATATVTPEPSSPVSVDTELQRLETAKWHPSSLGNTEHLMALFADEFVTVQYGADLHSGVERKLNFRKSMSGPEAAKVFQFLDQTHFDLSEWRFVHIASVGVIVSYHVSAPSFPWRAYATSVWTKRGGRWQTVFYQASTAK